MASEEQPEQPPTGPDPDTHLTILAALTFAGAGIALLFGLIAFWAVGFAGQQGYFWTGLGFIPETLGAVQAMLALVTALVTIPAIVGGIGLVKREEWGRVLTLAVSIAVGLFAILTFTIIPLAYTVYAIWVLTQDTVQEAFRVPNASPSADRVQA